MSGTVTSLSGYDSQLILIATKTSPDKKQIPAYFHAVVTTGSTLELLGITFATSLYHDVGMVPLAGKPQMEMR